jgi:hypothetical protein
MGDLGFGIWDLGFLVGDYGFGIADWGFRFCILSSQFLIPVLIVKISFTFNSIRNQHSEIRNPLMIHTGFNASSLSAHGICRLRLI